jgi:methionyl-tRNA synthetase
VAREAGQRLDAALATLMSACRSLAAQLAPFLPGAAAAVAAQSTATGRRLPEPRPLFPRLPA